MYNHRKKGMYMEETLRCALCGGEMTKEQTVDLVYLPVHKRKSTCIKNMKKKLREQEKAKKKSGG